MLPRVAQANFIMYCLLGYMYFRVVLFLPFYTCKQILPSLEFAPTELILHIDIREVVNSPADSKGKREENKIEAIIFLYTVLNPTQTTSLT